MRYSSFSGSKPVGLRGLGDVACERNLLKQLAAQFFYNLTGTETSAAGSLAAPFLYAYLGSTGYANNPVFPDGAGLLFLLQSYMAEYLGSSPDVDTLLAISEPTLENLTEWSGRVTIPAVQAMTRVQAEAAMLLCQTPAVDPAASAAAAAATAERARRDAETARVAAAAAAATAGTSSSTAAQAEAAIAAAAAAVAAQFAVDATAAATATPAAPATPTPTVPNTLLLRPGLLPSGSVTLTPAQRAALLATRNSTEEGTSYLPYVLGGGLLLAAAVVFASKSGKRSASGQVPA
jgi:hypothetical protein